MNKTKLFVSFSCGIIFFIIMMGFSYPNEDEGEVIKGIHYPHKGWGYEFNIFNPNAFLYFDQKSGGDVDIFKNGKATVNLQMVGFDYTYRPDSSQWEFGPSIGLGIFLADNEDSSSGSSGRTASVGNLLMVNLGGVLQVKRALRFEAGYILGISAKENINDRYDSAIYVGISIPTNFKNFFK